MADKSSSEVAPDPLLSGTATPVLTGTPGAQVRCRRRDQLLFGSQPRFIKLPVKKLPE